MSTALPIVIVCCVGIVACIAYIIVICVKALRRRPKRKQEFEIEDDVLTVKLSDKKSKN